MTDEIQEKRDGDRLAQRMREEGLTVVHSIFATIHHQSKARPGGWTTQQLDAAAEKLHRQDVERWKNELHAHYAHLRATTFGFFSELLEK